jgi:hypothetical protein
MVMLGRARSQNPRACVNVTDAAKAVADCIQAAVRTSPLPIYDRVRSTGHWRTVLVRTTEAGEGASCHTPQPPIHTRT